MPTRTEVVHVAAMLYPSIRATGYAPKDSAVQALDAAESLFELQAQREETRARDAEIARSVLPPRRNGDTRELAGG